MIAPESRTDASAAGSGSRPRAVFVGDFVHLERAFEEVAAVLADDRAAWLTRLSGWQTPESEPGAGATGLDGPLPAEGGPPGVLTGVVRIGPTGRVPSSAVALNVGPPRARPDTVIVPLVWEPLVFGHLLPRLEGDLELSSLGEGASRLALTGCYRAPLGQIGLGIDRLGMHHVAESSVRRFLLDVEQAVSGG